MTTEKPASAQTGPGLGTLSSASSSTTAINEVTAAPEVSSEGHQKSRQLPVAPGGRLESTASRLSAPDESSRGPLLNPSRASPLPPRISATTPIPVVSAAGAIRTSGTVKFFNSQKGYGFIIPQEGELEVFVHHTAILKADGGFRSLAEGEVVEFDLLHGPKGLQAANVSGPGGGPVLGDPNAHHGIQSPSGSAQRSYMSPQPSGHSAPNFPPFYHKDQTPQYFQSQSGSLPPSQPYPVPSNYYIQPQWPSYPYGSFAPVGGMYPIMQGPPVPSSTSTTVSPTPDTPSSVPSSSDPSTSPGVQYLGYPMFHGQPSSQADSVAGLLGDLSLSNSGSSSAPSPQTAPATVPMYTYPVVGHPYMYHSQPGNPPSTPHGATYGYPTYPLPLPPQHQTQQASSHSQQQHSQAQQGRHQAATQQPPQNSPSLSSLYTQSQSPSPLPPTGNPQQSTHAGGGLYGHSGSYGSRRQ
ncbi:cold-shock' DNA-binding domain-containing protein [Zopfochytrium polystomum]|nr:cold-shock' DNA-binding domain-containing protein [Zopfochytrium polystomum]